MLTPHDIGLFVDSVSVQEPNSLYRTPAAVAGRLIEEVVELCLATGASSQAIMGHVMDAIHNQCSKAGRKEGQVVYPTHYHQEIDDAEVAEEMADCRIILKDLEYITGLDVDAAEAVKWERFTQRRFYVSEEGTLYAIKSD